MNSALIIARKEIVDGLRDLRSLVASAFYALMGPLVVGLVSMAVHTNTKDGSTVLIGMMAVFTMVSAFVGGMNVAMDTVAGERERKSLLPLLLNPVSRSNIALGKWLAVSFFGVAGLALDIAGFRLVFAINAFRIEARPETILAIGFGLFSLPFLAAAVQVLISTISRGIKEAQTYLSLVTFLPMGVGMLLVFRPSVAGAWCHVLPLLGQQLQLEQLLKGEQSMVLQPLILGYLTFAAAVLITMAAANRLHRDEIIYGN